MRSATHRTRTPAFRLRRFAQKDIPRDTTSPRTDLPFARYMIQASTFALVMIDARQPDFPLVYVNPAFERLTGYTSREIMGKNYSFMQGTDHDQPESHLIHEALQRGEACSVILRNYRKDGSLFWNELHLAPVLDASGTLTHFVSIQHDVTARKEAELALARSEARYRQMFENNRAIKLVIDPATGRIMDANSAAVEFYGYPREQLLALTIHQINTLPDAEVQRELTRASREEQSIFEFRHRLASGDIRDVNVFSSPVDTEAGRLLYSIIVDMTDRRVMELRYRSVFEQSKDAVYIIGLDGKHQQVNRRATEMTGYTAEELYELSYRDPVDPVQREQSDAVFRRLLAGEQIPPYERQFRRKDGTLYFAELNVELVRDSNGTPHYIQSVVRDISERKAMEAASRAFVQDMTALQEIHLLLSEVTTLDALYPQMIRLAHERLGMERLGIFRLDHSAGQIRGTAGTDPAGRVRDECYYVETITPEHWTLEVLNAPNHVRLWTETPLYDDGALVGHGWKVASALWNGEQAIGYLCSDNLVSGRPPRPYETELVSILGSIFGHLIERKETEEALRLSEQRLRAMFEGIPDLIFRNRADGTYLDVHIPEAHRLIEPAETFIGKTISEVLPPPLAEARLNAIGSAITSGDPVVYELDIPINEQLRRYELRSIPVGEGEVITISRDVTDLWIIRQELQTALERLEFAVEIARIAWWEMNVATGRVYGAPRKAQMLGYAPEDFVDCTYHAFTALVHPDDYEPMMQAMRDLLTGCKPVYDIDYRIRHADGSWLWVHDRGELAHNEDGQRMVRGYVIDINERKQAQQRQLELLLEKERLNLLSMFIQHAAHEFRTPLSIINSSTYLMSRLEDPEQRARKARQVEEQVRLLTRLLDMLLTTARLESPDALEQKVVDVTMLIQQVCADMSEKTGGQPRLHCEGELRLPPVIGDAHYLKVALTELLNNAIRYTPPDGTVTIAARIEEQGLWLRIEDTGCGIAPEALPHIFETFWRSDEAHTTPGFGLGLPIARRIMEYHGGEITVASEVGRGTRFEVRLPMRAKQ